MVSGRAVLVTDENANVVAGPLQYRAATARGRRVARETCPPRDTKSRLGMSHTREHGLGHGHDIIIVPKPWSDATL